MTHHGYSLTELENMLPYERLIYLNLMEEYIRSKNEEIRQRQFELSKHK
jgi:hypothetical protein